MASWVIVEKLLYSEELRSFGSIAAVVLFLAVNRRVVGSNPT